MRRIAILGLAVAFLAAQTGTGSADDAAAQTPEAAYLTGIGVPPAEAPARLALEREAGRLAADAERRWPESFAGAWIDQRDGGRLTLAFPQGARDKVESLAASYSRPAF